MESRRIGRTAVRALAIVAALSGIAALAFGRTGTPSAQHTTAEGRVRKLEWAPGQREVYAVRWAGASRRDVPGTDDMKELGGMARFDGDVSVRSLGKAAGGDDTMLAYAIDGIRDYGLNVDGKELVSEADQRLAIAALKGQEAFVEVDDHGNVASIAYHHDTSSSTRELLRQLVDMMRVTLPDDGRAATWSAREPTPNGLAHVRYDDEGDALRRVRLSYDGIPGMGQGEIEQELSSTAAIRLDSHGILRSLEDRESLTARGSSGTFVSRWAFAATRTSSDTFAVAAVNVGDLDEASGESEMRRQREHDRDERIAHGWDLGSIEVQLAVYGKGEHVDPKFVPSASAYVRLHPEACAHLATWFDDSRLTDLGRQLVFDVLSAAGSPQAQAAMSNALGTERAREPGLRGALVQRFLFVAEPTPESARFVVGVYDGARKAGETRVAYRAASALGAMIEHMSGAEELMAQMDQRLRDDLAERRSPQETVALLLALGNARQQDDLAAIEGFAGHQDATVREQVARSLARFDDETASGALLELVRDPIPAVTRASFRALREQSLDEGDWDALARAVEQGQSTPRAYSALVDLLERRLDCGVERSARMLHAVLDRTPDSSGNRDLRERASRLLADLGS